MTWEELLKLGATEIANRVGCSRTTASSWINRGGPVDWTRDLILDKLNQPARTLSASKRVPKKKP